MLAKKHIIYFIIIATLTYCKTNTYVFVDSKTQIGLDFTKGKWLLNELDCDIDSKEKLTTITSDFFKQKVGNRFSYIKNEKQLLISQKSYFNASKSTMKDLKKGTNFDYFINVVTKKNRSDMAGLQLYQRERPGKNESEVYVEILDLNTQEVIYFEHVIGTFNKNIQKSMFEDPNAKKSTNIIDNININKTSNKLLVGSLDKILDKLDKTSVK